MFIQSYTQTEGSESQQVAHNIDLVVRPTLGDRPSANGRQMTGPRLCARMLQEYEAARAVLVAAGCADDAVQIFRETNSVGMEVYAPCGLTLCHAVQGSMVTLSLDVEDMHYHQQWLAAPMEVIEHSRLVHASEAFLSHADQWRQLIGAAYKADSKGSKLRNMALNNMDVYLQRYFAGTGITYYFDKKHADGKQARLLVRLNGRKTLDLPIPHDNFIQQLDVVRPHMVRFAIMARDGHFTVRNEARSDWQQAPPADAVADKPQQPEAKGLLRWLKRLSGGGQAAHAPAPATPLQREVDAFFVGKPWHYHLVEDEARREVHVRLSNGMSMIIDVSDAADVAQRLEHDMGYANELVTLRRQFPYRMTGSRKVEWITASKEE